MCIFRKDWCETSLEPSGLLPLLWLMGICLGKVRVRCFQLCYHVSEALGASKSYYQNLIRTLSGPKSSLGNINLSYPPTLPRHYPLPVQLFKRSSKEMPSQSHLTVLKKRDQFCWERQFFDSFIPPIKISPSCPILLLRILAQFYSLLVTSVHASIPFDRQSVGECESKILKPWLSQ